MTRDNQCRTWTDGHFACLGSGAVMAVLAGVLLTGAVASAASVHFDLEVDHGGPILVGDTVGLKIYATVTNNTYNGNDLGLFFYLLNIHSDNGYFTPVHVGAPTFNWNVQWHVPITWLTLQPGVTDGISSVNEHGSTDGLGTPFAPSITNFAAVTQTLLVEGYFQATTIGSDTFSLSVPSSIGGTDLVEAVRVVIWNDATNQYGTAKPQIVTYSSSTVTVVPEPMTFVTLMVLAGTLGARRPARRA